MCPNLVAVSIRGCLTHLDFRAASRFVGSSPVSGYGVTFLSRNDILTLATLSRGMPAEVTQAHRDMRAAVDTHYPDRICPPRSRGETSRK